MGNSFLNRKHVMDRRRPITLLLRLPNMKILQRIKIIELDGISDYYGAGT